MIWDCVGLVEIERNSTSRAHPKTSRENGASFGSVVENSKSGGSFGSFVILIYPQRLGVKNSIAGCMVKRCSLYNRSGFF